MFYALRRHAVKYEKERERVKERRGNTVADTVPDPQKYEDYITERKKGRQTQRNEDLEKQIETLKEYAVREDRDHLGMTRIHDLYQQYYLRFGQECTGLLEARSGLYLEVSSSQNQNKKVYAWNQIAKQRFEQVFSERTVLEQHLRFTVKCVGS